MAVLIMLVTIIGGLLALVDFHATNEGLGYGGRARVELIQAVAARAQATQTLVYEQEAEITSAQLETLGRGSRRATAGPILAAEARASSAAARAISPPSLPGRQTELLNRQSAAVVKFENHASRTYRFDAEDQTANELASSQWGSKSAEMESAITILAVSLFLFGLSQTAPIPRARVVFIASGVGIAMAASAFAGGVLLRSVATPSKRAINDYVSGYADISTVSAAPTSAAVSRDLRQGVARLDQAIALRGNYADALFLRAYAEELRTEYLERSPHGSAAALDDLRAAIRAGGDEVLYETTVADVAFWLGRYATAVGAADRAVALSPGQVSAAFNQAQYLHLVPGISAARAARASALLRRDFTATPAAAADESYRKVLTELDQVIAHRALLANRARQWRRQLTQMLGQPASL